MYMYLYLINEKAKALNSSEIYKVEVQTQLEKKIMIITSDGEREYYGRCTKQGQMVALFSKFLKQEGIVPYCIMPRTPQQNDVAERRNHTYTDIMRNMLNSCNVLMYLCSEALKTVVY